MKCKACNGTGYVTACVYESDEIGFVDKNYECAVCHGTGQIEQTNEEWFDGLSTEEKAEWLDKVAENCCQICDEENRELCRGNIAIGCKFENAKKWEMWLKQPHADKE